MSTLQNKKLSECTGYKSIDLKDCIQALLDLQLKKKAPNLVAIRDKYKQHRVSLSNWELVRIETNLTINYFCLSFAFFVLPVQVCIHVGSSSWDTCNLLWWAQGIVCMRVKELWHTLATSLSSNELQSLDLGENIIEITLGDERIATDVADIWIPLFLISINN